MSPIEKEGGVGPDIVSPIWTSTAKADPATWEAIRLDAPINLPNEDKNMSAEQMHRWRELSGTTAHKWVSRVIDTPDYKQSDDEGRRKIIAKTMELARAYTKDNVLSGTRIPGDEPDRRPKRSRSGAKMRPTSLPPSMGDMSDWELVQ